MPKKPKRVTPKKGPTHDPMQGPTPTAAQRAAKRKGGKESAKDPDRAQCTAHKRNGDRCNNPPVRGAVVCRMHGAGAPQVKAKANQRLIEMVLPAMRELRKIIDSKTAADSDKLKAINMVLQRTGFNERHSIDIGLREPTPFDNLDRTAFRILRGMDEVVDTPTLDDAEHDALSGGDGGGEDEALEAFLAERDRSRQRDAETRIDNAGHEVITGEVSQRDALDPFFTEERRRAEWERTATEYDPRAPKDDPQRDYADRLRERVAESERRRP